MRANEVGTIVDRFRLPKYINKSERVVSHIVGFDSSRNQRQRWKRICQRNPVAPMKAIYMCLSIVELGATCRKFCLAWNRFDSIHKKKSSKWMQTRARDHIDSISEEKTHAKMLILQGTLWNGSQGTVIDRESPGVCVCVSVCWMLALSVPNRFEQMEKMFFFSSPFTILAHLPHKNHNNNLKKKNEQQPNWFKSLKPKRKISVLEWDEMKCGALVRRSTTRVKINGVAKRNTLARLLCARANMCACARYSFFFRGLFTTASCSN